MKIDEWWEVVIGLIVALIIVISMLAWLHDGSYGTTAPSLRPGNIVCMPYWSGTNG